MPQATQELMDLIAQKNAQAQAWMDEDEGRWAGMLVEDPAWWAERGVFTIADYERWSVLSTISDLHKEAFGFRPRGYDFDAMSNEELFALADEWSEAARLAVEAERENEALRVNEFEELVRNTIEMGAGDRETAIRWIVDAETDINLEYDDAGYTCYILGIPHSYEVEISAALKALRNTEAA